MVQTVRSQYKLRKNNFKKNIFLDDRRIAALNTIGFTWDVREDYWEKRFQELKEYKEKHGDCNVPTAKSDLGRWVNAQRTNYQEKLTKMARQLPKSLLIAWNLSALSGSAEQPLAGKIASNS